MPWWHDGGYVGSSRPWLGSALAKTNKIRIDTSVTALIRRYSPTIVSQVFATLGLFPERVFLTVGTGEAVNEVPSGNEWPSNAERFERLKEAVYIIKTLGNEEWIDYADKYYKLKDYNLYTKPQKPIPLYISAMGPQTAKFAGDEGDGLVTNEVNVQNLKDKLLPAFKEGVELSSTSISSTLSHINNNHLINKKLL
jgi:coenzyme F420-dependent glucose-6-phosphate dehydrogenase